jgi:WD40 repeat protein
MLQMKPQPSYAKVSDRQRELTVLKSAPGSKWNKLFTAAGISATALAAAVVLQATFWWWSGTPGHAPLVNISVQNMVLLDGDRTALILFTAYPWALFENSGLKVADFYDLSGKSPRRKEPLRHGIPWMIAGSPDGRYAFLCTQAGALYWFDVMITPRQLHYLGSHPNGYGQLLECSDDGALLLMTGGVTTLWDRAAATLLWTRSGSEISSCSFWPGSHRLICGLATGDLVELDPATGLTLRQIDQLPTTVSSLSLSPDGQHVASCDSSGNCKVTELATGRCIWSYGCRTMSVVRFAPDGQSLLVSHPRPGIDLALFSLDTGQPLATLDDLSWWIKEVRVTREGTAYIACVNGTITTWDLASGAVTSRFKVGGNLESPYPPSLARPL